MKYSSGNTDQDFIAAAMPSFINEAGEQTQALETLLLELEEQPHNRELLDSLFRCAHTIKGSAGIFGLDAVVEFTHHVETLLDRLREGRLLFTPELSTLLLRCNDQIRLLVASATSEVSDTLAQQNERVKLVIQLCDLTLEPESPDTAASALLTPLEDAPWLISARFGAETFRNGMDPLSIARYLSSMGQVLSMHCVSAPMPALADLDPETCYLGFDMVLHRPLAARSWRALFALWLTIVCCKSTHLKRRNKNWHVNIKTHQPRLSPKLCKFWSIKCPRCVNPPAHPIRLKRGATSACRLTGWMRSSICLESW